MIMQRIARCPLRLHIKVTHNTCTSALGAGGWRTLRSLTDSNAMQAREMSTCTPHRQPLQPRAEQHPHQTHAHLLAARGDWAKLARLSRFARARFRVAEYAITLKEN